LIKTRALPDFRDEFHRLVDRDQRIAYCNDIAFGDEYLGDRARPGRDDRRFHLHGFHDEQRVALRHDVANRDVGNFASQDPTVFLDNTWKLLPETNNALRGQRLYTVTDYRLAIGARPDPGRRPGREDTCKPTGRPIELESPGAMREGPKTIRFPPY